jgi:phage-related protein
VQFIKTMPVNFYKETSGNEPVRIWLHQLSVDDRKIIGRDIRIVQIDWPIGLPLVKNLGRGIWEIRSKLDNRISRVLFIFHDGTMILLHAFIKKTQKTPPQEIDIAIKRAKNLGAV